MSDRVEPKSMECCKCSKTIDVTCRTVPPTWFGSYENDKLQAVICPECLAKVDRGVSWRTGRPMSDAKP